MRTGGKISEADLRKSILAVEAERLKNRLELGLDRTARSKLQKSRAASE